MEKRFTLVKLTICVLVILAITLIPFFVQPSYAQDTINDDVEFLATGGGKAILYWRVDLNAGGSEVRYQISKGLETWDDPQSLAVFPSSVSLEEFDGIITGKNLLLASFAVLDGTTAKIIVYVSKDKGETWSDAIEAGVFANATFNECPVLNSQYDFKLGGQFSLVTLISSGGSVNVYVLTSKNGIDWDISPALGGDDFPDNCED